MSVNNSFNTSYEREFSFICMDMDKEIKEISFYGQLYTWISIAMYGHGTSKLFEYR